MVCLQKVYRSNRTGDFSQVPESSQVMERIFSNTAWRIRTYTYGFGIRRATADTNAALTRWAGIEPATSGSTVRCSSRLNYHPQKDCGGSNPTLAEPKSDPTARPPRRWVRVLQSRRGGLEPPENPKPLARAVVAVVSSPVPRRGRRLTSESETEGRAVAPTDNDSTSPPPVNAFAQLFSQVPGPQGLIGKRSCSDRIASI